MDKWDKRFMDMAKLVSTWSKDPHCKVGAVVVSHDKRQTAFGYNGLPRNIEDTIEILRDRNRKNKLIVHAELNALLNASFDTKGCKMYVTKFPCCNCAQAIIQAGICSVVSPDIDMLSSWRVNQIDAMYLLQEAHVEIRHL